MQDFVNGASISNWKWMNGMNNTAIKEEYGNEVAKIIVYWYFFEILFEKKLKTWNKQV